MPATATHWTAGAPKWAAVIVLGAASCAAIGWSMGRGGAVPRTAAAVAMVRTPESAPASVPPTPPVVKPVAESAPVTPTPMPSVRTRININTASQGELEILPGIGPALAKRIIDHRTTKGPFRRVDDLDAVKGIGPKILERLRPQVTVD